MEPRGSSCIYFRSMIGAAQGCGICHEISSIQMCYGSTFFESAFKIRSVVKGFIYLLIQTVGGFVDGGGAG